MCWISDVYLSDCSWSHLNWVLLQRLDTLCSHPVFSVSPGWWLDFVPLGTKSKCSREVTSFALSVCCYLWKGSWQTWGPRWSWDQREILDKSRYLPLVCKHQDPVCFKELWNWTYLSPYGLKGCTHGCWGRWLAHCESTLEVPWKFMGTQRHSWGQEKANVTAILKSRWRSSKL